MILVVIAFPGLVMNYKSSHTSVDPSTIKIEIPGGPGSGGFSLPPLGGGASPQQPSIGLPPLNLGGPSPTTSGQESQPPAPQPALGLPPLNLGGPQPQNTQPDLGQPPKIGP